MIDPKELSALWKKKSCGCHGVLPGENRRVFVFSNDCDESWFEPKFGNSNTLTNGISYYKWYALFGKQNATLGGEHTPERNRRKLSSCLGAVAC